MNGWCSIPSTVTAEIVARQGFDTVSIDLQHGLVDYQVAVGMLQAGVLATYATDWLGAPAEPAILPLSEVRPGISNLQIELKYSEGEPAIKEIARVSKPDRRVYSNYGFGVLAATQGRRSARLVVNQALPGRDGRAVRGQLQQVIDRYVSPTLDAPFALDLLGEVPSDPAVRDAVRRRQLLVEAFPGAPAAQAIGALAARLSGG